MYNVPVLSNIERNPKMKTFSEIVAEINEMATNVTYREEGRPTTPSPLPLVKNHKVVGWFNNKANSAEGWVIYELDREDTAWLKTKLRSLDGIYRVATDKNTSIAKIDFNRGTYAFVDNKHLTDTDEVKFDRMTKAKTIILDKK